MNIFVYPGKIKSKNDGDIHYVGFLQLCKLYGLNPNEAINANDERNLRGIKPSPDDRHYFPADDYPTTRSN